jgi:recombination protein RecA
MNQIFKERGLPLMMMASDLPPQEFVSSGIPEIDAMTGGFPRGKVSEIYGMQGVGKTSLMLQIFKKLPELQIAYVDAEQAINEAFLKQQGITNVELLHTHVMEQVMEQVEVMVQTNHYDLIVIDSVASITPWPELEGNAGDAHMGLKARLMGQFMRKILGQLNQTKTALVFINQLRENMSMYGPAKFTPGGHALPFAASLRLELKTNKVDRKDWGHVVHVEVTKSKVSRPFQKADFKLKYS